MTDLTEAFDLIIKGHSEIDVSSSMKERPSTGLSGRSPERFGRVLGAFQ
jgi:hypothetical protein